MSLACCYEWEQMSHFKLPRSELASCLATDPEKVQFTLDQCFAFYLHHKHETYY
jgi:hypothetical protein